ncbi:Autophagy-related protein 16-1 [Aphelenchoides avenae]|nr:Autophagy-related protein 16-1 [Aphelenchus avenae]
MAAKQKLRQRNRSTADDAASGEEVEALRQELGEVYKKKAINDQQLIDTNNKLAVVEKELKKVTKEYVLFQPHRENDLDFRRDDALKRMKEMEQEVERARNTAGDTLADNQLIKDELLALHAMYDALNTKYLVCDEERNQLIDRLKEMKEHEVAVINEFNEKEQERQRQRLCAAIEEAAKPNPVADAKAFEMIGLDGALSSVDFGVEHFDDVIPERCALKFECDEMGEVNDCLWHPNGKMLFTAGSDKNIRLFEFANETCTKKLVFH